MAKAKSKPQWVRQLLFMRTILEYYNLAQAMPWLPPVCLRVILASGLSAGTQISGGSHRVRLVVLSIFGRLYFLLDLSNLSPTPTRVVPVWMRALV